MLIQRFLVNQFSRKNILETCRKMTTGPGERVKLTHKVNNFEKKILVWTGKYKSLDEVPDSVGQHVMERARNRMRIKISNYMMGATALGCILMIFLGKESQKRGESVSKMAEDWHKELKVEKVTDK